MAAGEITRENWLECFCELDVSPSPPIKNQAYIRGWNDALLMVRAMARHVRADGVPKNKAEPEHLRDDGLLTKVG